jgi:uncharacterized membrane protein
MDKITFKLKEAQRVYDDYLLRVEKNISILSKIDRNELVMEINSHIYEGMSASKDESEINVLLDIIGKLGAPEEFLRPLVARKKLDQAVRSYNPKYVYQAISLNIKNGIIYTFFGLLYLFLFSFVIIIFTKIFFPTHTGLFYENGTFHGIGFIKDTTGLTEVLRYWIIPLSILLSLLFYFGITLLLRITRKQ